MEPQQQPPGRVQNNTARVVQAANHHSDSKLRSFASLSLHLIQDGVTTRKALTTGVPNDIPQKQFAQHVATRLSFIV